MARFIRQGFNLSYKNYLTTGFLPNKHYSVLSSYNKFNYDYKTERNVSPQKIQYRNFSFEGYFRFINKLSNSDVCCFVRNNFINLHELSGLPWWSLIVLTTATARILLSVLTGILQEKTISEMWNHNMKFKNFGVEVEKEAMALARKNKWALEKTLKIIKAENKEKVKQHKDRSILLLFRTVVLVFLQIGLWITFSLSINGLNNRALLHNTEDAKVLRQQLSTEGTLWFKDLLKPDRFVLPGIMVAINFIILEIQDLKSGTKTKIMTHIIRPFILFIGYICSQTTSNISLYWVVSSAIALASNLVLLSPRIRKIFKIQPLSMLDDPNHPYKNLWKRFRTKYRI